VRSLPQARLAQAAQGLPVLQCRARAALDRAPQRAARQPVLRQRGPVDAGAVEAEQLCR
jgi:hypothetical protein